MKKRINRRKEFYQSRLQQSFPFRDTLINYIVKNPSSPKLYQKLIKTCKYFFAANPILVVKNFKLEIQDDDECNGILVTAHINKEAVDFEKICGRIWVTKEIEIDAECWGEPNINTISTFLLKIFKCHAKKCVFDYLGDVSIKDFLFLTPKCKVISLCCFTVIDDDGSTVTLEKIVEVLPRIKAFYYYFYAVDASKIVSTGTVEKLLQVPHISKICKFFLDDVPESFDIERFFAYIKETKTLLVQLEFHHENSVEYDDRVVAIIKEITETENHAYQIPWLYFPFLENFYYDKMLELCPSPGAAAHF